MSDHRFVRLFFKVVEVEYPVNGPNFVCFALVSPDIYCNILQTNLETTMFEAVIRPDNWMKRGKIISFFSIYVFL